MTDKTKETLATLRDHITETNRKVRILDATIKNLEALVERAVRPLREQLKEHEQALELIAEELERG